MKYRIPAGTQCKIAPDDDLTPYRDYTAKSDTIATYRDYTDSKWIVLELNVKGKDMVVQVRRSDVVRVLE